MPVGPLELLLILVVILAIVLLVRGPKVLPQFGEAIGKTVKGIRDNISDDDVKPDADTSKADADASKSVADESDPNGKAGT